MNVQVTPAVQRTVKDTVFRCLFSSSKENALSLYNAVNKSSYINSDDLEFTTLDDAIYMGMKNDNSFLFQGIMNLYEHQSTYNPNMPIRGLLYSAKVYEIYLAGNKRIYSKTLVKIPTPKYIVFYNGLETDMTDDIIKLRLSDAFEMFDDSGEYEWTATMININAGHSSELMNSCKILSDYSKFISLIKGNRNSAIPFEVAVERAIDTCISQGILADFLIKMKGEVKSMILTEFDREAYEDFLKDESYNEGKEAGISTGIINSLLLVLSRLGPLPDDLKSKIEVLSDVGILNQLILVAAESDTIENFMEQTKALIC